MTWRERAHAVIAEVMHEHPGVEGDALRRLLRRAYPFGERAMHPYRAWMAAVRSACGPDSRERREQLKAEDRRLSEPDSLFREVAAGQTEAGEE